MIDLTIGLRISEADEDEGMDASIHGEQLGTGNSEKYRVELPPMGAVSNPTHTPPSIDKLDNTQSSIVNHNEKKVVPSGPDMA